MDYERFQFQQMHTLEADYTEPKPVAGCSLQEQILKALPPISTKRKIASDFGVGPPPLISC